LFSVKDVDVSQATMVAAMGHALLTLGVGVGAGIVYGAYAPRRIPIGRSVLAVAVFDTVVGLLAGLAIYPVVLANNIEPAGGPGLLFISAPYVFGNVQNGEFFVVLFFVMIVIAALGAAIALMEPAVAALRQWSGLHRIVVVPLVGGLVWVASAAVTYSLAGQGWFANYNLLLIFDELAAGVLLPLVSLFTAVLVGWRLHPRVLREQLNRESNVFFSLWRALLRYIAPLAMGAILLANFYQ
jgi:neurotransmitter:Na+ symporter, NSS family